MEHAHAAAPQQFWRHDAGRLSRSLSIQHRRGEHRLRHADFARTAQESARGEIIRRSSWPSKEASPGEVAVWRLQFTKRRKSNLTVCQGKAPATEAGATSSPQMEICGGLRTTLPCRPVPASGWAWLRSR